MGRGTRRRKDPMVGEGSAGVSWEWKACWAGSHATVNRMGSWSRSAPWPGLVPADPFDTSAQGTRTGKGQVLAGSGDGTRLPPPHPTARIPVRAYPVPDYPVPDYPVPDNQITLCRIKRLRVIPATGKMADVLGTSPVSSCLGTTGARRIRPRSGPQRPTIRVMPPRATHQPLV